jgi:hypothetical protein
LLETVGREPLASSALQRHITLRRHHQGTPTDVRLEINSVEILSRAGELITASSYSCGFLRSQFSRLHQRREISPRIGTGTLSELIWQVCVSRFFEPLSHVRLAALGAFLADDLPLTHRIRVEDGLLESVLNADRYDLVIDLAGRHHLARLVDFGDGRFSMRLDDPDAAFLARCREAICWAPFTSSMLTPWSSASTRMVVPSKQGFLHLFAHVNCERKEQDVDAMCLALNTALGVDLIALGFQAEEVQRIRAPEPHFAFDAATGGVVRRNWGGHPVLK